MEPGTGWPFRRRLSTRAMVSGIKWQSNWVQSSLLLEAFVQSGCIGLHQRVDASAAWTGSALTYYSAAESAEDTADDTTS